MILALDPGKDKCGVAVLDAEGLVLEKKIISTQEISQQIPLLLSKFSISLIIIGQSAFGKKIERELSKLELRANLIFVSEKYSTQQARQLYWKENPPQGLWRLIPTSLRTPPVPIDDYAAIVLGKRYLKN
jgi:RNase H-fold protein (predicted Holliday junction resolvase)